MDDVHPMNLTKKLHGWLGQVSHFMAMVGEVLEFLLHVHIEHHQFTDNSAARQLISKQGVGRIRHLSAKLLWLQDLVRLGELELQ